MVKFFFQQLEFIYLLYLAWTGRDGNKVYSSWASSYKDGIGLKIFGRRISIFYYSDVFKMGYSPNDSGWG